MSKTIIDIAVIRSMYKHVDEENRPIAFGAHVTNKPAKRKARPEPTLDDFGRPEYERYFRQLNNRNRTEPTAAALESQVQEL